jgi:hypothetical protein
MRWCFLGVSVVWAQSFTVRAALEAKAESPLFLVLKSGGKEWRFSGYLQGGQAHFDTPQLPLKGEVFLEAPGYLPLRYKEPIALVSGGALDFTQAAFLHPRSAYVEKEGKACLAAGELGRMPGEPYPVINAYDIELFLQVQASQTPEADFNGDGQVDARDYELLLKNQALLLHTEL